MSLVIGFVADDFLLLCGDTQLNFPDGSKGTIQKVHIFNDSILWGYTGSVKSNLDFIQKYVTDGKLDITKTSSISFKELNIQLAAHYNNLKQLYDQTGMCPDFNTVIGGVENEKFVLYSYSLIESKVGINKIIAEPQSIYHLIMGKYEHETNFNCFDHLPSIDELKQMFQDILNKGISFDDTINNQMTYVYLQKG